jgi:opacity protein-like surface antigen
MMKQLMTAFLAAAVMLSAPAWAETKTKAAKAAAAKTYDEDTFIRTFSNKTKQQISDAIGEPERKQMSVKPSNADNVVGQPLNSTSKPVNVEMWYYKNLVRYDAKRTYKTVELTFVNGHCANMAFFNNQ